MESMILKPSKAGLKVFNPATKLHLRQEGDEVSINNYWRRMIACGDAVEVKKSSEVKKKVDEPVNAGENFNEQKNKKK